LAYAKNWEDNINHVMKCDIEDLGDGFQLFNLITKDDEGNEFFTESYRSLDKDNLSIFFKQKSFPKTIEFHNGVWEIGETEYGKTIVSITHSLLLSEEGINRGYKIENIEKNMHKKSEMTLKTCEILYLNKH